MFEGFQELKEFIATYEPFAEMKIPEVNILLIGQAGAGKSSLSKTINSNSIGGMSSNACSRSAEKGITQKGISLSLFILDGNLSNHYTVNKNLVKLNL